MSKRTLEIFTCDRCGRDDEHYNTLGKPIRVLGVTWLQYFQKRDVCKACYGEFEQWWFGAKFPREGAPK